MSPFGDFLNVRRFPGLIMTLLSPSADRTALTFIKMVHTIVWAFFASAVIAIPVAASLERWTLTAGLIALVSLECAILVVNRMRCPLTSIAARYTDDRQDNFDIFLPLWLARYNKQLFGTLFILGIVFALLTWWL